MKNAKNRSTRVASRDDVSATKGPIDKRQTRMCREMHGLAYAVSLDERRVARAVPMVQSPAVATQHPRWSLFSVSISVVGGRQTTK